MDITAFQTLLVERRGAVDWVTLNRPERLNALDSRLTAELGAYFHALYREYAVRVVVLRGAGRAFCAGLDLQEYQGVDPDEGSIQAALDIQTRIRDIMKAIRRCPQPVISLVHGAACGGGFSLALAADVRLAGESARMNAAYIRVGLSGCDMGSSYFLPRLVGVSVASELLLTGRFIDAARALRVNLVSEVVPDAALEAAAAPYIEEMLANTPLGLRLTKDALSFAIDAPSMDAAMAMEDRQQILAAQTADHREALRARGEKRPPVYRDR
jgi:enoyl-CoA hydratase